MNKSWLICIAAILIIFIGFAALSNNSNDTDTINTTTDVIEVEPIEDSSGKVSAISDLALYYNNDKSIYGYFDSNDNFQGIAYYDDANIKGTINLNLSDVKWDENYTPGYEDHVNNVSYAKKHFLKDIKKDYKNDNVSIHAYIEFEDKKGNPVDLYSLSSSDSSDGKEAINISLKGDILKLKVKHRFKTNKTIISNDVPYEGALTKEPSDYDKTYKAKLTVYFENDDYEYRLKSTLKDEKFYIIHT